MTPTRLVYRVAEVAALLSVERSTVYDLIRDGALQARQQRRYIVVTAGDLAAYVNALPIKNAPADEDVTDIPALPVRSTPTRRGKVARLVSPIRSEIAQ